MPKYEFENRDERRLRGMQAFDRAAAGEERVTIARERLDLQRTRDETNLAIKAAEASAKAEQDAARLIEIQRRTEQADARIKQAETAQELMRTGQLIKQQKDELDRDLRLREEARTAELHPITAQAKKLKLDRDASDFALDNVQEIKIHEDTQGFNSHMAELYSRGAPPDELKAGFDVGMFTFPNADPKRLKAVGDRLFRKPDGEPMTLDEMSATAAELRAANPNARISVSQKGGATVSEEAIPPALKAEAARLDKEYFAEVAAWNAYKKTHGKKSAPGNEAKIEELRTKRDAIGAQIHALNNPAPAAVAPNGPPQPDITPDEHAALKPGDSFWWKGRQLIKK